MTPEIKRILYATDLSENARHAFSYAADLARRYDAKITVLYVMETLSYQAEAQVRGMMGRERWDQLRSEYNEKSTEEIKSRINDFCSRKGGEQLECRLSVDDIRVPTGTPHVEILKTSKAVSADLIVMGSHGYNLIEGSLIGGTARRIVKESETPVLVVRLPGRD